MRYVRVNKVVSGMDTGLVLRLQCEWDNGTRLKCQNPHLSDEVVSLIKLSSMDRPINQKTREQLGQVQRLEQERRREQVLALILVLELKEPALQPRLDDGTAVTVDVALM